MSESKIAILETKETIFFSHRREQVCQWIMVAIENRSDRPVRGTAAIAAGGEEVSTPLEILPGVREYRCLAPILWPRHPAVAAAPLRLTAGTDVVTGTTSVGTHRPWTVYLLSDVCTDYTWVYADEETPRADDAALLEAELAVADARRGDPEADRNHYNFVHARETEFFLEHFPHHAEKLFNHIRRGTVTLNPFFTMCMTCDLSL